MEYCWLQECPSSTGKSIIKATWLKWRTINPVEVMRYISPAENFSICTFDWKTYLKSCVPFSFTIRTFPFKSHSFLFIFIVQLSIELLVKGNIFLMVGCAVRISGDGTNIQPTSSQPHRILFHIRSFYFGTSKASAFLSAYFHIFYGTDSYK